jgi:putative DNA primase/helicase
MKRKKQPLVTDPRDMAAPSDLAMGLDDPQEIRDAEQLEETGDFGDDAEAEAEVMGGERCGVSASQVADRLLRECSEDFRFLTDRKIVFSFRDGIWQPDTGDKKNLTHELFKKARRLCLQLYEESNIPRDFKAHLRSGHFPASVVGIAVSEIEHLKFADSFDDNPDLLGIPGGRVVELQTGDIRDAQPTDYISKSTTISPDPTIKPVRFLRFLKEITKSDTELSAYLIRLLGYLCTGRMTEEFLGFWTGIGANGKSILVDLLTKILGEYVAIVSVKLLASGLREDSEQELRTMSHLCGARAAFASESSKRLKIDIGLAKKLAAPEKLLGRNLYEDAFSFRPSHKLIVSAQALEFEAVDWAIQRRLHVVNFPQKFCRPEDMPDHPGAMEIDKNIGRDLDAERPGILALLVNEARAWYSDGLTKPDIVRKTSDAFFTDADDFGQWLKQNTTRRDPAAFTPGNVLFANYVAFAEEMGVTDPLKRDLFSKKLISAGFKDDRARIDGRQVRGFHGLRLRDDEDGDSN